MSDSDGGGDFVGIMESLKQSEEEAQHFATMYAGGTCLLVNVLGNPCCLYLVS
jgi:hypothetical protein